MGLADKLNQHIVSRGLGAEENLSSNNKSNRGNLRIAIYKSVGNSKIVSSFSEEVEGWKYDKEIMPERNSEFHKLGGHTNLSKEGMLDSDFQGSIIQGCEVKEIQEKRSLKNKENITEWLPAVERGTYSTLGEKNTFFGENYQSQIVNKASLILEENCLLDTLKISRYTRNENFINNVNKSFVYDFENKEVVEFEAKAIEEKISIDNKQKTYYLKRFPISNFEATKHTLTSKIDKVIEELGVIIFNDNVSIREGLYSISYDWTPLAEYEIYKKEERLSKKSIKPYKFSSPNGLIEISNEEKHVTTLNLSANNDQVNAGNDSLLLTARCLNSRGKPVDEVAVRFLGDEGKDILFEGNLSEYTSDSNGDGKAFAQAYFPLNRNSLSIVSTEIDNYGNSKSRIYLPVENNADYNKLNIGDILVFEMLKIDPYYGSNGISGTISQDTNRTDNVYHITIDLDLMKEKIKSSKNNIEKDFVNFANFFDCGSVYNTGWIEIEGLNNVIAPVRINAVEENKIQLEGFNYSGRVPLKIKLFVKNDAGKNSNNYLDKVLYKIDKHNLASLIRPTKLAATSVAGNTERYYLEFDEVIRDPDIFEDLYGYRIFANQSKLFRAECIDPATGKKIFSNELPITVNLPSYYKSEIVLRNESPETGYIGIGSYIMIDDEMQHTYTPSSGAQQ